MGTTRNARPDFTLSPYRVALRPIFAGRKPGDVVTYDEMRAACGMSRSEFEHALRSKGFRHMAKVELAKSTGRFAVAVEGVGYKVGTSVDAVEDRNARRLRAQNQFKRALAELSTTKTDELTTAQQTERDRSVRGVAGLLAATREERGVSMRAIKGSAPRALPRVVG